MTNPVSTQYHQGTAKGEPTRLVARNITAEVCLAPREGFQAESELGLLWALGQPAIDSRARPLRYRSFASLPYCPFSTAVAAPGLVNRAHRADKLAEEAHAIINEAAWWFGRECNQPSARRVSNSRLESAPRGIRTPDPLLEGRPDPFIFKTRDLAPSTIRLCWSQLEAFSIG